MAARRMIQVASLFEQSVFDDPLVKVDPCVKTEMIAI
jgi:hypothetical protein